MQDSKHNLAEARFPALNKHLNNDGVDRRGFLKCMAWAGTGLVWTMYGGIPVSRVFADQLHGKLQWKMISATCRHEINLLSAYM